MDHAYRYVVEGRTVALLVLDVRDERADRHVEITWLTSHPAVAHAATMMVEKAVNVSESLGLGGVVRVTSLDYVSDRFYAAMHFERIESGFRLVPASSSAWTRRDGVWRLA